MNHIFSCIFITMSVFIYVPGAHGPPLPPPRHGVHPPPPLWVWGLGSPRPPVGVGIGICTSLLLTLQLHHARMICNMLFNCCPTDSLWSCHQIPVNTNDSEREGTAASETSYARDVHQEVLLTGPDREKATP